MPDDRRRGVAGDVGGVESEVAAEVGRLLATATGAELSTDAWLACDTVVVLIGVVDVTPLVAAVLATAENELERGV